MTFTAHQMSTSYNQVGLCGILANRPCVGVIRVPSKWKHLGTRIQLASPLSPTLVMVEKSVLRWWQRPGLLSQPGESGYPQSHPSSSAP